MKASPDRPPDNKEDRGKVGGDASRGEVAIYAFGNVEGAIADNFPNVLQNILVVAAHVNPLLLGMIMGIKTLWDAVTDPVMAYITDNTRSRFGRRRPYILVGGVARVLFLAVFILFLPTGGHLSLNPVMEAQKAVSEGESVATRNHQTAVQAFNELSESDPAASEKVYDLLEGKLDLGFLAQLIGVFVPPKESAMIPVCEHALDAIRTHLPTLQADFAEREDTVASRKSELAALEQEYSAAKNAAISGMEADSLEARQAIQAVDKAFARRLEIARGILETAEKKRDTAGLLIEKGKVAQSAAIAAQSVATYLLVQAGRIQSPGHATREETEREAQERMRELGVPVIPVFAIKPPDPAPPGLGKGPFSSVTEGFRAFFDPRNHEQRALIVYVLLGILIFTTLTTVNSVPYYALGIELSPSYDGRTQVVVYRSVMNKVAGLLAPWVPVFCFSLLFLNAFQGLFWVAVFACLIGIPSTVLMFFKTRERTQATVKKAGERPNIFLAMFQIAKEPDFLRILFLYVFFGLVNGLFAQIGFFLNVYWVTGSALSGATLGAQVSMIAWVLGFLTLPVINWACRKFQKHRVLQFAVIWMSIGTALKWWLMDPRHPEYQFILPFFFSVGIGSVFTVLPTMMADVTDLDEHKYGLRREGMFGAVMAFLMKGISTIVPVAAGAILVLSGFDPTLEYRQNPQTILNMRILYSLVPAVMLLGALFVLHKYPLTRERVERIKDELKARHALEDAASA